MKLSKSQIHFSVQSIPELRFEDQRLTSFSGCVLLQELFRGLRLRSRLRECFEHRSEGLMVGFPSVVLILIVHLMLGFRRLRHLERYREVVLPLQFFRQFVHPSLYAVRFDMLERLSSTPSEPPLL